MEKEELGILQSARRWTKDDMNRYCFFYNYQTGHAVLGILEGVSVNDNNKVLYKSGAHNYTHYERVKGRLLEKIHNEVASFAYITKVGFPH